MICSVQALSIASESGWAQNDSRIAAEFRSIPMQVCLNLNEGSASGYGFLIYNASLVFWKVARPMCRSGWQKYILNETTQVLEALKLVRAASATGGGGGGGKPAKGGATAAIPVPIDLPWLIEMTLNMAFGLEDAGREADAQKRVEEASALLDELLKEPSTASNPALAARGASLQQLVWNAKAFFSRKAPGKVKDDVVKASGSAVLGATLFICNGGTAADAAGEELIKAWSSIDSGYDLRAARDTFAADPRTRPDGGQVTRGNVKPQMLVDLALAVRAACCAKNWPLAICMVARLEKFQIPPGRGRILLDICKAECDVWQACNVKKEDPTSKMLLSAAEQEKREIDTRHRAVRLCEQCIMTARRIEAFDLIEECAVVMWNISRELMCDQHRFRIHKPLQKCSELLEEMQSNRLIHLRVQLHFEVAHCEVSSDLLTKGSAEYHRANTLDYTAADSELLEPVKQILATPADDGLGRDPAPYLRRFDTAMHSQLHLLYWKTTLYEEPTDPVDQVMLVLDQVSKVTGAKNEHGEVMPLSEEKKKLNHSLLVQAFAKLENVLEDLILPERMEQLSKTFEPPPRHILDENPLQPLPHQAPATALLLGGKAEMEGKPILDRRPQSEREKAVQKAKEILMLMCRCSLEAQRAEEGEFAVKVCTKAISTADTISFGPAPIEVEGALLLAACAYTKSQCLSWDVEDLGLLTLCRI